MATQANQRRGVETLELILVLPMLFVLLVAGIQFASMLVVDTTLTHASIEASRLASLGCSDQAIVSRTDEFLSVHGLVLGIGSRLVIEDATGRVRSFGDGSLSSTVIGTPVAADSVRSTLLVETDASPIPNLLPDFGVDVSGKQFGHVAVTNIPRCECP